VCSGQCDILVHDPNIPPLYRMDDFVVVHSNAVKAVVEVKSDLDERNFGQFLEIHNSLMRLDLNIPTFAYGLTGVRFDTFAAYIQNAVTANRRESRGASVNWPFCIAVKSQRYFGVRDIVSVQNKTPRFFLLDFNRAEESGFAHDGIETGYFVQMYSLMLQDRSGLVSQLAAWFNGLPVSAPGKVCVLEDGRMHTGNVEESRL
jgi:hypothetical protein